MKFSEYLSRHLCMFLILGLLAYGITVKAASLQTEKIFIKQEITQYKTTRIYAKIKETSGDDFAGYVWLGIYKGETKISQTDKKTIWIIGGDSSGVFWDVNINTEGELKFVLYTAEDREEQGTVIGEHTENVLADTDKDGIPNTRDDDDDNDGLSDEQEANLGTDPLDPDSDDDGVIDGKDAFPKDPNEQQDTDDDGIGDKADTDDDNDGLSDADEEKWHTDPKNSDTDGDGVSDSEEIENNTNPLDADTDDDGYSDGQEKDAGTDPLDKNDHPSAGTGSENSGLNNQSNDNNQSQDQENSSSNNTENSSQDNTSYKQQTDNKSSQRDKKDTDLDGIPDNVEKKYGLDPYNPDDANKDLDNDGLRTKDEVIKYKTDPFKPKSKKVLGVAVGDKTYAKLVIVKRILFSFIIVFVAIIIILKYKLRRI